MKALDAAIPGLAKVWREAIKPACGTTRRWPGSLVVTDESQRVYLDDGYHGKRFALNLVTMELAETVLHVSSGEWAAHGGPNHDEAVDAIPNGAAVITCEWSEYTRAFSMTVQVAKGAIPEQLAAAAA
jgi:hypothetical protein